jgi:hypothetical protein
VFRRTSTILAALALAGAASAGERPSAERPVDRVTEAALSRRGAAREPSPALPVLFWLPETRLGYGATGGLHFHLRRAERASSVFVVSAYTLNQQGTADVSADVNLPRGTVLATRLRAIHFPDAFYGVGPDSQVSAKETYTRRALQAIFPPRSPVAARPPRRVPRRRTRRGDERPAPGRPPRVRRRPRANVPRADGRHHHVGTRATGRCPRRGTFAQAWFLQYLQSLGDQPSSLDPERGGAAGSAARKERVLGTAAFIEEASGTVPFTVLPRPDRRGSCGAGGGRFRDHVAWAAQSELRVPVAGRWVGAAFGALGDVAPGLGDLRLDSLKVAGGVGLRYRLTREGANIRFDFAVSPAGPELYVLVLDAF